MRKAATRAALVGAMLASGLLYAGISQAEEIRTADQAERTAELVAANGGPASPDRLIPFAADRASGVETRADDVAPADAASQAPQPPVSAGRSVGRIATATLAAR